MSIPIGSSASVYFRLASIILPILTITGFTIVPEPPARTMPFIIVCFLLFVSRRYRPAGDSTDIWKTSRIHLPFYILGRSGCVEDLSAPVAAPAARKGRETRLFQVKS